MNVFAGAGPRRGAAVSRAPGDLFAIDSENHVASTFWADGYEPDAPGQFYALSVVPANDSPGQAYSTHTARVSDVVRQFAEERPLKLKQPGARHDDDDVIDLIADQLGLTLADEKDNKDREHRQEQSRSVPEVVS